MKNKVIRPLIWYKKVYSDDYDIVKRLWIDKFKGSSKDRENAFYYLFGFKELGDIFYDGYFKRNITEIKTPTDFFFKNGKEVRKLIITEMGRLLIYGLYYEYHYSNLPDITKDICSYIFNSWKLKQETFNEKVFTEKLKHIRINYIYYSFHPQDLKLYILESFFNDEITSLLPKKPKELERYEFCKVYVESERKRNLKKDKNYYIKRTEMLENYIEYIKENGFWDFNHDIIDFDSYEEMQNEENKKYWKELDDLEKEYKESLSNIDIKLLNKNIS